MKLGNFLRTPLSLLFPKCWGFTKFHLFIFYPLIILLYRLSLSELVHFSLHDDDSQLSTSCKLRPLFWTQTHILSKCLLDISARISHKFIMQIMKLFSTKCTPLSHFPYSWQGPCDHSGQNLTAQCCKSTGEIFKHSSNWLQHRRASRHSKKHHVNIETPKWERPWHVYY